jgi:hypothetical protein
MKKSLVFILTGMALTAMAVSCSKSDSTTAATSSGRTFSCSGINPKFAADVQPIFTTVCSINSGCHGAGSTNSGGPFTSYTLIAAKTSNIRAAVLSGVMPQSGTLTQAQINSLICWIDNGALNN